MNHCREQQRDACFPVHAERNFKITQSRACLKENQQAIQNPRDQQDRNAPDFHEITYFLIATFFWATPVLPCMLQSASAVISMGPVIV